MAIPVNPLSLGSLAALAGMQPPHMYLPLHGIDYSKGPMAILDALKTKYASQQDMAKQQAANQGAMNLAALNSQSELAKQSLQDQNAMARTQYQTQGQLAQQQMQNELGYAQLDETTGYHNRSLDQKDKEIGIDAYTAKQQADYQNKGLDIQQQNADTNKSQLEIEQEKVIVEKTKAEILNLSRLEKSKLTQMSLVLGMFKPGMSKEAITSGLELAKSIGMVDDKTHDMIKAAAEKDPEAVINLAGSYGQVVNGAKKVKETQLQSAPSNISNKEAEVFSEDNRQLYVRFSSMRNNIQDLKQQVANIPSSDLGPSISNAIGLNKITNPNVRQLESDLVNLAGKGKELVGMGKGQGAFSDKDAERLDKAFGGIKIGKEPLQNVLNRVEKELEFAQYRMWEQKDKIRQKSSDYKDWKISNPDPIKEQIKEWKSNPDKYPKTKDSSPEELEAEYKKYLGI